MSNEPTPRTTLQDLNCVRDQGGQMLIELLQLRVDHRGRVRTKHGDKRPLGLYRMVRDLVRETESWT